VAAPRGGIASSAALSRRGCRLKPAVPSASAVEVGEGIGFDRLSAVDAGWKPALRTCRRGGRRSLPVRCEEGGLLSLEVGLSAAC